MHFFTISFKNSLVYRSSVLFRIIGSIFFVFVQIALWTFIFKHDDEMTKYMISYVILSNIIGLFYSDQIRGEIGGKVSSGMFAIDLIRPVNIITMSYQRTLGSLASKIILSGIPVILVFMPLLINSFSTTMPINILYAFIAVVLGHYINMLLYSLIGFMSFIFLQAGWVSRIVGDTIRFFSGALIPLSFFPDWLRTIADLLPFKFLYSFPLELMLNNKGTEYVLSNFTIMIGWIVVLTTILLLSYKGAINRCTVQGG